MQAIRTLVLLTLSMCLVVPVGGFAHPWAGAVLCFVTAAASTLVVVRFLMAIQADLEHGNSMTTDGTPSVSSVIDVCAVCVLAVSLVWYGIWLIDDSPGKSESIHWPSSYPETPYAAFVTIVYLTAAVRIRPLSVPAYMWAFTVLLTWLWLAVTSVTLFRRSLLLDRLRLPTTASPTNGSQPVVIQKGLLDRGTVTHRGLVLSGPLPSPMLDRPRSQQQERHRQQQRPSAEGINVWTSVNDKAQPPPPEGDWLRSQEGGGLRSPEGGGLRSHEGGGLRQPPSASIVLSSAVSTLLPDADVNTRISLGQQQQQRHLSESHLPMANVPPSIAAIMAQRAAAKTAIFSGSVDNRKES